MVCRGNLRVTAVPSLNHEYPMLVSLILQACVADMEPASQVEVTIVEQRTVVPSGGLPVDLPLMDANNNLDVVAFEGRIFLAFRTAPTHFASADTLLHVISSADELAWRHEGTFHLGTDIREPGLVVHEGALHLFFAELGSDPIQFEPNGTWRAEYFGVGEWSEPEKLPYDDLIVWRLKPRAGRIELTGYSGGENIYAPNGEPLSVHWWASDDLEEWRPAVDMADPVWLGGSSETDLVVRADGSVVAVMRNEAGDDDGFGSKVCTAPAASPGEWTCAHDPRKFDSPLVFEHANRVWLVGRRNLSEDGAYDVGGASDDLAQQSLLNQAAYWNTPKRCALWEVLPGQRSVDFVLDLPTRGDTCFPEVLLDDQDVVLYNYTSAPDGPDVPWIEGQLSPTQIDRVRLSFQDAQP